MPRFRFNIYNDAVTMDEDGIELPDAQAADRVALESARALASESAREGHLVLSHRIEILDDHDRIIHVVRFGDAVQVRD